MSDEFRQLLKGVINDSIKSIENDIAFYERRQARRDTPAIRSKLIRLREQLREENFKLKNLNEK